MSEAKRVVDKLLEEDTIPVKDTSISDAINEWRRKDRRMGCVAATDWFVKRVKGFRPERLTRYTKDGEVFEHVVATDGTVRIDLAPYSDRPSDPWDRSDEVTAEIL